MDNPLTKKYLVVRLVDQQIVFSNNDPGQIAHAVWGVDSRQFHIYSCLEPLSNEIQELKKQIIERAYNA